MLCCWRGLLSFFSDFFQILAFFVDLSVFQGSLAMSLVMWTLSGVSDTDSMVMEGDYAEAYDSTSLLKCPCNALVNLA